MPSRPRSGTVTATLTVPPLFHRCNGRPPARATVIRPFQRTGSAEARQSGGVTCAGTDSLASAIGAHGPPLTHHAGFSELAPLKEFVVVSDSAPSRDRAQQPVDLLPTVLEKG